MDAKVIKLEFILLTLNSTKTFFLEHSVNSNILHIVNLSPPQDSPTMLMSTALFFHLTTYRLVFHELKITWSMEISKIDFSVPIYIHSVKSEHS